MYHKYMGQTWYKLPAALLLPLLAGFIGSAFTTSAIPVWYAGLNKPFFSPPNWLFAPVWTLLYLMMGVAFYLVWSHKQPHPQAVGLFYLQLALNTLWSIIFFGLQLPCLAFIEIVLLWFAIFATIRAFYPVSRLAAYLLIPYLAWVSFASLLNLSISLLN